MYLLAVVVYGYIESLNKDHGNNSNHSVFCCFTAAAAAATCCCCKNRFPRVRTSIAAWYTGVILLLYEYATIHYRKAAEGAAFRMVPKDANLGLL